MLVKLLKPLSFIPAILMMYIIFGFSSQDGQTSAQLSYKVSHKIVEIGAKVIDADMEPWEIDHLAERFHTPVRKIAHMTEYFLLSITVAFPLYVYGLRGIWLMLVAGAFCVAFACGDEYHQAFTDGRGPSKRDVCIDSIGVFCGIIVTRIIGWTGRHTIFYPFAKKKVPAPEPYIQAGYPPMQYQNAAPYTNAPQFQGQQFSNNPPYTDQPQYQRKPQNMPYPPYSGGPQYNQMQSSHQYSQGSPSNYQDTYQRGYTRETTSDNLSEDMSFKKLMHDIKDQKQSKTKR